jgi:hypothetical protein
MFLYIGDYWVPFPSSEYGGNWVVMAENEEQCIDLLLEVCYRDEYHYLIPNVVQSAKVFQLDDSVVRDEPHVVEYFFT